MPPKRKRGGAAARGRRGGARGGRTKKSVTIEPSDQSTDTPNSPILEQIEQNETSSSNSSVLEEPAQPEVKIKLETKIHKKFGIKYHVPDEVVSAKPPMSPILEDVSSPTMPTPANLAVVVPPATDQSEESSNEEKMETEVVLMEENVVENEIADQFHHLGVAEDTEPTDHVDMHEVEDVELENTVVLEYVTHDTEAEGEIEGEAEEAEEVYYVVEEESQDVVEEAKELIEVKQEVEHEAPADVDASEKLPDAEIKMEVIETDLVSDEVVKANKDKKKTAEKPSRKSKRISLRGGRQSEENSPEKLQISPKDEVKEEPEPVEDLIDAIPTQIENKLEEIVEKSEESAMEVSPNEEKPDIAPPVSEIPVSETKETPENEVKDTKKPKKVAEKKKAPPKPKKPKEPKDTTKEKKKNKKQVTFKVQPKGKKLKDNKSAPTAGKSDKNDDEDTNIRRSSRIKTISTQKVRSRGKGLVKKDDIPEVHSTPGTPDDKNVFLAPTNTTDVEHKPVKVKSRWRRSSELEMRDIKPPPAEHPAKINEKDGDRKKTDAGEVERRLKQFLHLKENVYLTERISCKEAKKMVCDCFLTEEEIAEGEYGCGDDCLNRLLMIEW